MAFDAFPYTAGNTTAAVLFPPEMLPHLESILADPRALEGVKALGARVFGEIVRRNFTARHVQCAQSARIAYENCVGRLRANHVAALVRAVGRDGESPDDGDGEVANGDRTPSSL